MIKEKTKRIHTFFVRTYSDTDCPECGFPETVLVSDPTMTKIFYRECSKTTCDWARKVEGTRAEPIKLKKKKNAKP